MQTDLEKPHRLADSGNSKAFKVLLQKSAICLGICLDGISITAARESEHLRNLQKVLSSLEQ